MKRYTWQRVKTVKPTAVIVQPKFMKNGKNILFINANKLNVLHKMLISCKLKVLKKETLQILYFALC